MRLDELGSILGARRLGEGLKHAAAEQIFFERPPVVEDAQLPGNPETRVRVKYYDYGVLSVLFEFPFAGEWQDLIALSCRWISETDLQSRAEAIAKEKVERTRRALIKPYDRWLGEDYFIFFNHKSCAAKMPPCRKVSAAKSCSRRCLTIRMIWW